MDTASMNRDLPMPAVTGVDGGVSNVLAQARALFRQAVGGVARLCTIDGTLDPQRLDAQQPLCYEIALAAAELLAAETALAHTTGGTTLDQSLARTFVADALVSTIGRLDTMFLELGMDAGALQALACSAALTEIRHTATSTATLAALGQEAAESFERVGGIVLEGDAAMAQEAFRRFAMEEVSPLAEEIHRHDLIVPETLLQGMRKMGVFGLSIPEEYGGSAPSGSENALVMIAVTEALSEASLAAAGSLITRPEILARALMAGGTQAQKEHWLPLIAQGEPLCGIAITEPDHGSDVANLTLKATRTASGWRLEGAKTWCTFAGKAGLLMVVARTDADRSLGHRGLSLMLVEKPPSEDHAFEYTQPGGGRLTGRAIPTIGYRGMHSFDLAFENFFVPDDRVIGGELGLGKGFYFAMAGMIGGRMQTAARACGVMRASFAAAVRYVQDRWVFGAPLMDYSLTQAKIARMAARLAACRQLTYAVGTLLEKGQGRMEASLVKLFACRSAELISRESLQLHGGMGYAEETPVSRYFVDARVLSIFEGAEETLALKVIARSLLEGALKGATHD